MVKVSIWSDDFGDLSPDAKLLYLWSFTNPRCNMAGLYKVKRRIIIHDTGIDDPDDPLAELEKADHLYYSDPWIFVRSRVKHLHTRGQKIAKSIAGDVAELPEGHPLRRRFMEIYGEVSWLKDELSKGLGYPIEKDDSQAKSGRGIEDSCKSPYASASLSTDDLVEPIKTSKASIAREVAEAVTTLWQEWGPARRDITDIQLGDLIENETGEVAATTVEQMRRVLADDQATRDWHDGAHVKLSNWIKQRRWDREAAPTDDADRRKALADWAA